MMSSYYIIFMIREFAVTRIICVTNIIQWCLSITSHIIWSVKNERCGFMKIKTRTGGNNRGGWFTFDNDLNTIVGCDNNGSNHFIYLLFFMNILFIYLVAHIYIYIYITSNILLVLPLSNFFNWKGRIAIWPFAIMRLIDGIVNSSTNS